VSVWSIRVCAKPRVVLKCAEMVRGRGASGGLNGPALVLVPVLWTLSRLKFGFISREGGFQTAVVVNVIPFCIWTVKGF